MSCHIERQKFESDIYLLNSHVRRINWNETWMWYIAASLAKRSESEYTTQGCQTLKSITRDGPLCITTTKNDFSLLLHLRELSWMNDTRDTSWANRITRSIIGDFSPFQLLRHFKIGRWCHDSSMTPQPTGESEHAESLNLRSLRNPALNRWAWV